MPRPVKSKLMIIDACVLIDFIKADRSLFELIVKYIGPLYVISSIIEEVDEIENEAELLEIGLQIIEPEIEDAFIAASQSGPTSFQDRLCLFTAKRYGFTCVTNDKNLRKLCEAEKVTLLWGLQLIVELHRSGGIPAEVALDIAGKIHTANPKHITSEILKRFIDLIESHEAGS